MATNDRGHGTPRPFIGRRDFLKQTGWAAVVGTGLVGRAWAISFARAGHQVRLFDESADLPRKAVAFAVEVDDQVELRRLLAAEIDRESSAHRTSGRRVRPCRQGPDSSRDGSKMYLATGYREDSCLTTFLASPSIPGI